MKMHVVFNKKGEILWTAVQHSEINGEAAIHLEADEEAIDLDLGSVTTGEVERTRYIHQAMDDVRKNFHIVNRKLERRSK
jgi:hypothetical protein